MQNRPGFVVMQLSLFLTRCLFAALAGALWGWLARRLPGVIEALP